MAKRMMTVPCFPCTVCEDCGGYLSWWRREGQPQEEAWLECPKCHKVWQSDEIGYSFQDQFKAVSGMIDGIQGIIDIALERVEADERHEDRRVMVLGTVIGLLLLLSIVFAIGMVIWAVQG